MKLRRESAGPADSLSLRHIRVEEGATCIIPLRGLLIIQLGYHRNDILRIADMPQSPVKVMSVELMAGNCLEVLQTIGRTKRKFPLWLKIAVDILCDLAKDATRGIRRSNRNLLSRQCLVLCASTCWAWRHSLLAQVPPCLPRFIGLPWSRLGLELITALDKVRARRELGAIASRAGRYLKDARAVLDHELVKQALGIPTKLRIDSEEMDLLHEVLAHIISGIMDHTAFPSNVGSEEIVDERHPRMMDSSNDDHKLVMKLVMTALKSAPPFSPTIGEVFETSCSLCTAIKAVFDLNHVPPPPPDVWENSAQEMPEPQGSAIVQAGVPTTPSVLNLA